MLHILTYEALLFLSITIICHQNLQIYSLFLFLSIQWNSYFGQGPCTNETRDFEKIYMQF